MSKQFAFQKVLIQSGATYRRKWPFATMTPFVNGLGYQFFACAAFTLDQNCGVAFCGDVDERENLLHLRRFADDFVFCFHSNNWEIPL
jgi:hypothetical protein